MSSSGSRVLMGTPEEDRVIGEGVLVNWFIRKLADEAWKVASGGLKNRKAARQRAERLAKAVEQALEHAEKNLGEARAMVPVGLALRVREYLRTCILVAAGKGRPLGLRSGIDRGLAEKLLEPMETLFNMDAGDEVADTLVDAYRGFVERTSIELADLRDDAREALVLFFRVMARDLQDALRSEFGAELQSATVDGIRRAQQDTTEAIEQLRRSLEGRVAESIQRAAGSVVEAFRAADPSDETAFGSAIEDPEELGRRVRDYAGLLLAPVHSPLERALHRRIREVVQGAGIGLATAEELYVPPTVSLLGETLPGGEARGDAQVDAAEAAIHSGEVPPTTTPPLMQYLGRRCIGLTGAPGFGKTMELCTTGRVLARRLQQGNGWIVPVYVRLSPHSYSLKGEIRRAVHGYTDLVASAMAGRGGLGVLLLIDGFDETDERTVSSLLESLATLLAVCPRVGVVLAGRHQSVGHWRGMVRSLGPILELQPLDATRRRALVERLSSRVDPDRILRKPERILDFLDSLFTASRYSPRAEELTRFLATPLYLALYVVLAFLDQEEPPKSMAVLMRRFVRRFVIAAMAERNVPKADDAAGAFLEVLETFAADGSWLAGGKLREVDRAKVAQAANASSRFKTVAAMVEKPPERLAAELMTASGLFEGRGESGGGPWTFSLYPFQEYFAARGCVRAAKTSGKGCADSLIHTLEEAHWSAELAPQLVAVLVGDPEISFSVGDRRALLEALLRRLAAAVEVPKAAGMDLNLLLALRDELIAWDSELRGALVADGLGERLEGEFGEDPVVAQFRRVRAREIPTVRQDPDPPEVAHVPPGPLMLLSWPEERRRIREQVASVVDWLLDRREITGRLPETLRARLQQVQCKTVTRKIDALRPVLERLLADQDGDTWSVKAYGPTLAAFVPEAEEPSWILVPHGPFLAGDVEYSVELPVRVENVERPFWIALDPVTVGEFRAFLQQQGGRYDFTRTWWTPFDSEELEIAIGEHGRPGDWERQYEQPERPVVRVSWFEVAAYCLWKNRVNGKVHGWGGPYRLPTEAEWEKAARGLLGRRWPWGSAWCPGLAVSGRSYTRENLESIASDMDRSPFGARGMAGNVWEWTATKWDESPFGEDESPFGEEVAIGETDYGEIISLRGGSFANDRHDVRCAVRLRRLARVRFVIRGFRCLRDVLPCSFSLSPLSER